jgi:Protein of unknown function (DUF3800)
MKRLVVFCDESLEKGQFFSNFYGAALVDESRLHYVNSKLKTKMAALNLNNEVKWSRITANYQSKYIELVQEFFSLVSAGDIKLRLMFTQNIDLPKLTQEQKKQNKYFILYYQLIKHSFGWQYISEPGPYQLLLNFDVFPQTKDDIAEFKHYLTGLTYLAEFKAKQVSIEQQHISEVDSKKHVIMQCLDIVMGAMQFRLNNGHRQKAENSRLISKRAKAKNLVYKAIHQEITTLYPGYSFNIGVTTKYQMPDHIGDPLEMRWKLPYRHWKFVPAKVERNADYIAKNK